MKLTFTKGSGKYDRLEIERDGLPSETIDCPKQGIIPHDMVHHAVESTLLARGFLGRVMAGESANFQMPAEAESDSVERLVEVVQGDAWAGSTTAVQEMIEMYRVTCLARECAMLPVSAADIVGIRDRIAELATLWSKVPVGGSLQVLLSSSATTDTRR